MATHLEAYHHSNSLKFCVQSGVALSWVLTHPVFDITSHKVLIKWACEYGHIDLVDWLIDNHVQCWSKGLFAACRGGHRVLVERLLDMGADAHLGFFHACRGGVEDIVDLLIERGARGWNDGLAGACLGNHASLAESMIDRGATHWNTALYHACLGGHRGMSEYMMERGATDRNRGLKGACEGGHPSLVYFMLSRGATDTNCGLVGACMSGNDELVQFMLRELRSGGDKRVVFNKAFRAACAHGHAALAEKLQGQCAERGIPLCYTMENEGWNDGLVDACARGHEAIVELMIENGADAWERGLLAASRGGHYSIALLMLDYLKAVASRNYVRHLNDALAQACLNGEHAIAKLLLHHGADAFKRARWCARVGGHREEIVDAHS